jgi:cyclophilin family peptidyl-prolyl cis-trans isomerase
MRPRRTGYALLLTACLAPPAFAIDVAVCTDRGRFTIELLDQESPGHVANFLDYMERGFYSGTVFHRVVPDFVIQGGGYDSEFREKVPADPIPNESDNGLRNRRGTVAAARTEDPDSATSQFFVNLRNNSDLDASRRGPGYTVFGQVTDGMNVVEEIGELPTSGRGPFRADVPEPLVTILSVVPLVDERMDDLPLTERHAAMRAEIESAVGAEDFAAAMGWFDQYRSVCGDMTPPLLLVEAEVGLAAGAGERTRVAIEEFFRVAGDDEEGFARAIELYTQFLPELGEIVLPDPPPPLEQLAPSCRALEPPLEIPAVPDGGTVSMDAMVAAQTEVLAYVDHVEGYLACLDVVIDDGALAPVDEAVVISAYNLSFDHMEDVVERFNSQLRLFRQRE